VTKGLSAFQFGGASTAALFSANLLVAPPGGRAINLMVPLLFVSDALIQQQGPHGDRRQLAQE
jgi:hypothetical protein